MRALRNVDEAARFLWGWARNEPVIWVDPETKEEISEVWSRSDFWHTFKPYWWLTFATTKAECGCRKRFGVWPVLTCLSHALEDL